MNDLFNKFTVFDIFGYLLNGLILGLGFLGIYGLTLNKVDIVTDSISSFSLQEGIIGLFIAYILGHICQASFVFFENYIPKKRDQKIDEFESKQDKELTHYFKLSSTTPQKIIREHRYLFALNSEYGKYIEQFNILHYFFKGLFFSFLILFCISLFALIYSLIGLIPCLDYSDFIVSIKLFILLIGLSYISYVLHLRMNKFYDILTQKIVTSYLLKKTFKQTSKNNV